MTQPLPTVGTRYREEEIAGFYTAGYWQHTGLFDVLDAQAAATPDKPFVFDSTHGYSYRELRDTALQLAVALQRIGVGRGDRVAVQLPNWSEFALCVAAVARLGAVIVPIMPIYRDDEVAYVLAHSGAKVAVTCEEFKRFRHLDMFTRLRAQAPDLRTLVAVRSSGPVDPAVATRLDDLLDVSPETAAAQLGEPGSADDPLLIVYTSGTTARPKGCLHTFNTMRVSAEAIRKSLGYTADDIQFGPSPISHSTGAITSFVLPLLAGASSHLMEAWDPEEGLQRIQKYGCTVAVTATAFLQMLLDVYDPDRHDASSLRLWVCAGSPIPGAIVERATSALSGCHVLSLYGRSENFLTTMCTVADDPIRSSTSDGSAIYGVRVAIVDTEGNLVAAGEEGDIAYQGPGHMLAYFRDPEHTAELFTPEGYSRSGDLGVMDADGFVRVTGRLKDIVIRGGLNISARELEDLLAGYPRFSNVAVVAMPDERLGEKACLYAVLAPGQEAPALADVVAYLRERKLATPKLPERLEIIDSLPMTATGKVQKHVLRADIGAKLKAAPAS
ncbi:MAG TPA: AMP-binding protein [Jatrophihabitantaceae bacterium]|jgi:cyclohexanecarboxylate-CoA ligase